MNCFVSSLQIYFASHGRYFLCLGLIEIYGSIRIFFYFEMNKLIVVML